MFLLAVGVHAILGTFIVSRIDHARIIIEEADGAIMVVPIDYQKALEQMARIEQSPARWNTSEMSEKDRRQWVSATERFVKPLSRFQRDVYGGTKQQHEDAIENHIRQYGSTGFIAREINESIRTPDNVPANFWLYAGCVILWWMAMLICQGEGLDLDLMKRRHPHWEWLLSHPVKPMVAFTGEYLAPLMANPVYITAPVFWFVILNAVYPLLLAIVGALVIGLMLAIAASCMNKSLEIAATLRLQVKNRGVFLGLVSMFGYFCMILPLFLLRDNFLSSAILSASATMEDSTFMLWISRALMVGWSQTPVLWQSVIAAATLTSILMMAAALVTWWGTRNGLQAAETRISIETVSVDLQNSGWIKDAYYKKELLWLRRDRGAVVQIIVVPFALVAFQALNLQPLAQNVVRHWSTFCGLSIICGTYFLLVVGPRSLTSEGSALWIAQTWPRSLESMLRAKASLWFGFSTCLVFAILASAVVIFPEHWWQVVLVALAWLPFGWGLALKSVCLITVPSSSGEAEKPPKGRQWAATLGTLVFGGGVIAESWHVAVIGVVISSLTAAAMWQNLRARLPFLFDPWSEQLPRPPTLMHAMIGIAIMVECIGVATAIATSMGTPEQLWLTRAIGYAVVGVVAYMLMNQFLSERGVAARDIWIWTPKRQRHGVWIALSFIAGIMIAGVASVYLDALRAVPFTSDYMEELDRLNAHFDDGLIWQLVLTVALAPVVEEYFFRGLLYRALDRELGGWKAMVSSSAFFAIYHPPFAWVPVFLVGLIAAWAFRTSGRLWPCVIIHMTYNFLVVIWVQ